LTFDKAAIDVSGFMPGQAYVALSRLRSLEGLILLPLRTISNDGCDGLFIRLQKNY
jgi:hypothetical protein